MTYPNDQGNPAGAIPVYLTAASNQPPYRFTPLGYTQITNLSAAVGLGTIPAGATIAFVSIEGGECRYRDDGTAPTATIGMPIYAGQALQYSGTLSAIQLIQTQATATANISFYK